MFHTTINIKAVTWQRTRSVYRNPHKRMMPPKLRAYYYAVYDALTKAGLEPLEKAPQEYAIKARFYFKDKRWRDCDNLIKAVLDSGQPSKWAKPVEKLVMPDLWDDRLFADVHGIRYRGAGRDAIEIEIGEWNNESAQENSYEKAS